MKGKTKEKQKHFMHTILELSPEIITEGGIYMGLSLYCVPCGTYTTECGILAATNTVLQVRVVQPVSLFLCISNITAQVVKMATRADNYHSPGEKHIQNTKH
jgi:hypothetical protein